MARAVSSIRQAVKNQDISRGLLALHDKLIYRLETKGRGQYASRHEIFGILAEEMDEALDELRENSEGGYVNFKKELLDVAVAAIFGYICLDGGYIKRLCKTTKKRK